MPALDRKPDATPAPQNFETELLKITEAFCVHSNLPIRRRFTDAELVDATARVRDAVERQQPVELDKEPSYWDEKAKDRREEFLEEADFDRERAYPRREP